jgi:hypothetical protein
MIGYRRKTQLYQSLFDELVEVVVLQRGYCSAEKPSHFTRGQELLTTNREKHGLHNRA